MKPITGQVRCSGKMHQISIVPDGPVILHDHSRADLAADRIMVALGGELCRCSQVLRAWHDGILAGLPAWAHSAFNNSRKKRQRRIHARMRGGDPFYTSIAHRVLIRLRAPISDSIQRCSYRIYKTFPNPRFIGCYISHTYRINKERIKIYKSKGRRGYVTVQMDVLRWYNHVYKRGLAVVSGFFVLDVLSEDEHGYTVLAGRQNADLSIDTVRGRITTDATGAKTLQWLDDTKGG